MKKLRSAAKALHHKNVYQLPLELRDIYAIIDIHILKLWQGMWDNLRNLYYSYEPKVSYKIV